MKASCVQRLAGEPSIGAGERRVAQWLDTADVVAMALEGQVRPAPMIEILKVRHRRMTMDKYQPH